MDGKSRTTRGGEPGKSEEERGVEQRRAGTVVAGANRKRGRPEAGRESHFIRKMPESGDERTIRPNESQGEAVKTDLGWARSTIPEKRQAK